jgi:nitrous oxide reductase accessory protein NosL
MKRILLLVNCAAALLVAGCASTVQYVPMPDQSKAVDDPAKGRIYVMRPASVGGGVGMNVSDSGNPIGKTGPKGFLCWERQPGDAEISSSAENVSKVSVPVRPGSIHYVFQHLRMGIWIARNELELVGEEEGKKQLKKCKPAKYEQQKK